jgi:glycosyltransferase involved in cell wall biosynthesis
MNQPLISVITPCYNCEKHIAETIESVLAQTYPNWEMLIIDDCSTDKSFDIIQDFAGKDKRIKTIKQEQRGGVAAARNKAIEISQGEYLAFLDGGDLWFPQKLEKQLNFMIENNCDFSFTRYEHIDKNGKTLGQVAKVIKNLTYSKMLFHDFVGCLTVVYKQNLENKIYSPIIKRCNDYALFLKVLRHTKNAMGINENLAKYRILNNSLSKNKLKKTRCFIEMMTKYEKQNIFAACFYLLTNQAVKFFWKYERKAIR